MREPALAFKWTKAFLVLVSIFFLFSEIHFTHGYVAKNANLKMLSRWCCLNDEEFQKCSDWKLASNLTDTKTNVLLECVKATDKFDCYKKIFEDKADLMSADAGEIYTAGKYYNLLPISSELYSTGNSQTVFSEYYSVAVVKKGSNMTIDKLRGSNSCHSGVGTSAGWNIPISTLIEKQLLEVVDCNNHVKAATKFFNKMCAPDALNVQFNPTGDNPTSACDLCVGKIGSTFCTNQDPYAGSVGAMYCLMEGGGDVAFVMHTAINELIAQNNSIISDEFELLCPNVAGSPYNSPGNVTIYPTPTAPISNYMACNWGVVPGRAIITSSRKALAQRAKYRDFLKASAMLFSGGKYIPDPETTTYTYGTTQSTTIDYMTTTQTTTTLAPNDSMLLQNFSIFDSVSYGGRDLIFLDQTVSFKDLDDRLTYLSFLRKFKSFNHLFC